MKELAAGPAAGESGAGLYDADPWSWSRQQVEAMERGDYGAVDWDNVIEEIADVGNRHADGWTSRCENVVSHLLKIQHDPDSPDLRHWRGEVWRWREQMHGALDDSPGMKDKLFELLAKAWKRGRRGAVNRLVESAGTGAAGAARGLRAGVEKRVRRGLELRLPRERPFHVEDITSYDPFDKNAEPDPNVWPAPVARVLNERLGTDYPVRERGPEQERGRGAGLSR